MSAAFQNLVLMAFANAQNSAQHLLQFFVGVANFALMLRGLMQSPPGKGKQVERAQHIYGLYANAVVPIAVLPGLYAQQNQIRIDGLCLLSGAHAAIVLVRLQGSIFLVKIIGIEQP